MRKLLLALGVLLSLGIFCACSSDDEFGTEFLVPIEKGDSIVAISDFFKTAFDTNAFTLKNYLSNEENPCIIINSEEEFENAYTGDSRLPAIDFSKYTLITGKVFLCAGSFIDNMNIKYINREKAILFINCVIDMKGFYIGSMYYQYYWNLFPKFHASIINVEVIRNIVEIDDSKKQ